MSQLRVDELVDEEGTGSPDFPFGFTIGRVQYSISGDFPFTDSGRLTFGADSDLRIYHNGSGSFIDDAGTGRLYLRGNDRVQIQKYTGEDMITAIADGAVKIYYDNAKKFETTSAGIDVSGGIVCSPNTAGKDTFELSTSAVNEGRLRIKNVDTTTVEIRAGGDSYFNGGDIGIGTTSPSPVGLGIVTGGGAKGVMLTRGAAGTSPTNGQGLGSFGFKGAMDGANSMAAAEAAIEGIAAENHSGSTAATDLAFYTKPSGTGPGSSPTERVRITAAGNVGLGVASTTSGFKLDVIGDARFSDVAGDDGVELGWSAGASAGFVQAYDRGASAFRDLTLNNSMTIDTAGRVTKPYQPAFRVAGTGTWTSYLTADTYHKLALTNEIFDIGSNYNNGTYDFTCPVTGMYQFTISMYANHGGGADDDSNYWSARFGKNGGVVTQPHIMKGYTNQGDNDTTGSMTSLIYCSANDTIQVYIRGHAGATIRYYPPACCFSGHLVG